MRYIFFCIYNSQYLDGKNRVNTTPWFTAVCMMMGGSFCCVAILAEIYYFYILNQNFPSENSFATFLVLFAIHYFLFIKDKRYEKIYDHYKASPFNNRKTNVSVSLSYIFIPAAISMLIAMKWHKVI
ncbi:MAG: hypothetical protein JWP71_1072 [Mucilaginibacter sp.]|nr:hypothetical protein [Mucilaginibacter sp.]